MNIPLYEQLEPDPYVELANDIKANLKKLEDTHGEAVTGLRERFEKLDENQRDTDEGLKRAKKDAADAVAEASKALELLAAAEKRQSELETQVEEFTRGGGFGGQAPDEETLAEADHMRELAPMVANPDAPLAEVRRFGDEAPLDAAATQNVVRYRAAYGRFLRGRQPNFIQLQGAMPDETFSVGSQMYNPSYGFMVPVTYTNRMIKELFTHGTIRGDALVRNAVGNVVHLMYTAGKTTITIGNENLPYEVGDIPEGFDIQYSVDKWQCTVSLTSDVVEDVRSLPSFLASQAGMRYAEVEADKHIHGTGVNQPLGLLSTPKTDVDIGSLDKSEEPLGTIKAVKSGVANALHSTTTTAAGYAVNPFAHAIWNLHGRYRSRAKIYMNRLTYVDVLTMVDGDGQYLLPTSIRDPGGFRILGHMVVINDHLPDIGNGAYPVIVGDLRQGYEIADRRGVMALIDPYTDKPRIEYTYTWRSGGRPADTRALRLIKSDN